MSFLGISGCDTIGSDLSAFGETFSPPTPIQAATWAVDTNDAENQRRGIALLASAPWGGAETYVKLYRLYIEENSDPLVKAFAIRALGRHGDAADSTLVAKQLDSEFRIVRLEAAKALQRLHEPSGTEVADAIWTRMVNETEDTDIRTELAIALGQYQSDSVFQALVNALDQRDLAVNWAALDSLQTLTGRDFGLEQTQWLAWKDSTKEEYSKNDVYLYPTFQRDRGWLDYVLFWVPLNFESPGIPIGSPEIGVRRTYQGEAPAPDFQLPVIEKPEPKPEPKPPKGSGG